MLETIIIGNNNLIVHQMLEEKATPYPVLLTLFRRTNGIIIVSRSQQAGVEGRGKIASGGHNRLQLTCPAPSSISRTPSIT